MLAWQVGCRYKTYCGVAAKAPGIAVTAAVVLLASCAAPMTGLKPGEKTLPDFNAKQASVAHWLAETQAMNARYAERYELNANLQPWFDVPIIGLAIAGAGSLLFGGSAGLTAGLGLGAGGVSAIRAYVDPAGTAADYRVGVAATHCMIAAGSRLILSVEENGNLKPAALVQLAGDLSTTRIVNAGWLATTPPDGSGKQEFIDAQTSLRIADDAAAAVLTAYQQEQTAARAAASVLAATLGRVKVAVASAVQRQPPQFSQVQSDVTAIVEQAGAQRERLRAARDLIGGTEPEVAPAAPTELVPPPSQAAQIRAQAVITANEVSRLRGMLPGIVEANAAVVRCQPT